MKKILPLLILTACSTREMNGSEFMIQSQVPSAKCETAVLKGIDVAICDVPGKDKVVQFIGAYSKGKLPFQVYPLKDGTEAAPEGQGNGANASPPPAPVTVTPDAGSGK